MDAYQSDTMSLASTMSNVGDEQLMFKVGINAHNDDMYRTVRS
jgi:hypothetical protein